MTAKTLSVISQLPVENNPRPPTAQLMKHMIILESSQLSNNTSLSMLKLVISLCGRFAERVCIRGSTQLEPCMQTRSANLPQRDITNFNIDNKVLLDSCDG